MQARLTMTPPALAGIRDHLLRSAAELWLPAGLARGAARVEFLLPAAQAADFARASVRVAMSPPGIGFSSHLHWHAVGRPSGSAEAHLELLLARDRGCGAAAFLGERVLRVAEVALLGPSMEVWIPGQVPPDLVGDVPQDGRHSRYVGALGGRERHRRLQQMRCLGIGCGRLNSLLCVALSKAGADTVLVDPDRLESHSEDAVECLPHAGGERRKVDEVARFVAVSAPWAKVTPLAVAADAPEVLHAARDCHLVFSAPDRDEARFAATLLAIALHRVHLDLGTGVFDGADAGGWRAGADVRLVLPGSGCLLCMGGLDLRRQQPLDWRRQRAGSLRSLNQVAVGAVMLLLERLVVGDLRHSTWLRIEVTPDGVPSVRRMGPVALADCMCCGPWAGAGDALFFGQ